MSSALCFLLRGHSTEEARGPATTPYTPASGAACLVPGPLPVLEEHPSPSRHGTPHVLNEFPSWNLASQMFPGNVVQMSDLWHES